MEWSKVAGTIGSLAPLVGTAIAGPLGGAAGGVVAAICNLFDVDPSDPAAPQKLDKAIQMDPNAALKLREFQLANKVELEKIALQRDQVYLADRASARQREMEVVKATGKKDLNLYFLAYLFVFGFFAATIAMMYLSFMNKLPEEMPQYVVFLLGSLFGTLTAGVGAVIQYFFGSSKGSADKTMLLAGGRQEGAR